MIEKVLGTTRTLHLSVTPMFIMNVLHREMRRPYRELLLGLDPEITDYDIEIQLLTDAKAGKVYTIGGCDHQDERGRCLGHELTDDGPPA